MKDIEGLKNIDQPGNPLRYYNSIIQFLGVDSIYIEDSFTNREIATLFSSPNILNIPSDMFITKSRVQGRIVANANICSE